MRAICVEDDRTQRERTVALCGELELFEETIGFATAEEALVWLERETAELAVLDIHLPGIDGMVLARTIRARWPGMAVLFLTADPAFAVEAFSLHVSGYLLKPVTRERFAAELEYALASRRFRAPSHITVQTFGNFGLQVDGRSVNFRRSKARELLAYLVDRQGGSVTRAQIFAALWEDENYDRKKQKQLDVVIRSLRGTLQENGISEILELKSGYLRIRPELLDCDLYRFLKGEMETISAYRGEYLSAYSWSSLTEAYMTQSQMNEYSALEAR